MSVLPATTQAGADPPRLQCASMLRHSDTPGPTLHGFNVQACSDTLTLPALALVKGEPTQREQISDWPDTNHGPVNNETKLYFLNDLDYWLGVEARLRPSVFNVLAENAELQRFVSAKGGLVSNGIIVAGPTVALAQQLLRKVDEPLPAAGPGGAAEELETDCPRRSLSRTGRGRQLAATETELPRPPAHSRSRPPAATRREARPGKAPNSGKYPTGVPGTPVEKLRFADPAGLNDFFTGRKWTVRGRVVFLPVSRGHRWENPRNGHVGYSAF